jgi:hypothetical protein
MIIWNGWGVLTILFAVIGMVTGGAIGAAAGALIGGIGGGAIAAFLNHVVAKAVTTSKVVIDPATQQEILLKKSSSLFFIPMKWFTPIFAVTGVLIGFSGMQAEKTDKQANQDFPGKVVFEKANDLIDSSKNGVASYGNTPDAEKAAEAFSSSIKNLQAMSFEVEGNADKRESKDFITYCHEGKDGITFICHVPGMSSYKDAEAKKGLSTIAWLSANMSIREMPNIGENTNLTVGLRGYSVYGSIQQGKFGSDESKDGLDKEVIWKLFDPASAPAE